MTMLPKEVRRYRVEFPKNKLSKGYLEQIKEYTEIGYNNESIDNFIITQDDATKVLSKLGISKKTAFYDYYTDGYEEPENNENDLLYGLEQIVEDSKNPFWKKHSKIGKRYLQMSSIEGEWSYFYDKETDFMYGVDWNEMDDFVAGKLKPLFTSFYDFLEWYYSEEE